MPLGPLGADGLEFRVDGFRLGGATPSCEQEGDASEDQHGILVVYEFPGLQLFM